MASPEVIVVRTLIGGVTDHLRTRLSEWVFAALLAVFACRLLQASDTFSTSKSYAYMASIMTEDHWGQALGAVAALRLTALGINGSWKPFKPYSPAVRACTAWLSATAWFCLAFGFWRANPDATGWSTYGVLFIADLCLAFLIAGDAGSVMRRHRNGRT